MHIHRDARALRSHTMPQCKIRCGLRRPDRYHCFYPFCLFDDPAYTRSQTHASNTHERSHKHFSAPTHMHTHTHTSIHVFLASCLKYAVFFVSKEVRGGGGIREKWDKRESERELSHRTTLLRAAVALPDFPLIAFSWYLNPGPFGFWRPAQTPQSPQRPIQLPDPSLTPCRG